MGNDWDVDGIEGLITQEGLSGPGVRPEAAEKAPLDRDELLSKIKADMDRAFAVVVPNAPNLRHDTQGNLDNGFALREAFVSARSFVTLNPNATQQQLTSRADMCVRTGSIGDDAMPEDALAAYLELHAYRTIAKERGFDEKQLPTSQPLLRKLGITASP